MGRLFFEEVEELLDMFVEMFDWTEVFSLLRNDLFVLQQCQTGLPTFFFIS